MELSSPIKIPPGPSWVIINRDNPISLPVIGQFDPKVEQDRGKPIWQTKPGIFGAQPWLKFVGQDISSMTFEFHMITTTILDPMPLLMWERLVELSKFNESLGRPPRIIFSHGINTVEGFITELPAAMPMAYWGGSNIIRSRMVREVGPGRVKITKIPYDLPMELPSFTNYVPFTEDTNFEELARAQYGDARYAPSLNAYNQGRKVGGTIDIPRQRSGAVTREAPISPVFGPLIPGFTGPAADDNRFTPSGNGKGTELGFSDPHGTMTNI